MNILIVNNTVIPAVKYGGTERVIWGLGKELAKMGHAVTFLVGQGSQCPFAKVLFFDPAKTIAEQIPADTDIVHFNFTPKEQILKPYIVTVHGNSNDKNELDINTVFVSKNHANRYGSDSFVYNGLDWSDYGKPDLQIKRKYFHFLGNAAWRVKNIKGAINVCNSAGEKLVVLGGKRLNLSMGFRFTISPNVRFYGMVDDQKKSEILSQSKGLVFPVRWHEPFGLALIESLYFGCPLFGSPYGSLPEIVKEDVGFLSNSSSELTKALRSADNFSKKKCHEYAADIFNSRKMAEAYLKKYEEVLEGKKLNLQKPVLKEVQTLKFLEWRE